MTDPQLQSPLLEHKEYAAESVFLPESLLREARRQKGIAAGPVPKICVLDPDGDIVRLLRHERRSRPSASWACYHTTLEEFDLAGQTLGIIGCAVGAPFAVLLAEQLFASGCALLVSITSAGQLVPLGEPPYFVLIERALRDEGTSHHYMAPDSFSCADPDLMAHVLPYLFALPQPVHVGSSWTTDAPYRETEGAIAARRDAGIAAVEMEAAALYAFAAARGKPVLCFAHVTNRMAQTEGDFEKGTANGAVDALGLIARVAESMPSLPHA
jgi:uridine phosphorylase